MNNFDFNIDYHIQDLSENGYTVIKNVYNEEEIIEYWNLYNKWNEEIPELDYLHSIIDFNGIYKHHEVGQQRFAWLARTNPKIQYIFKKLWNTDDIVTGFDGCCYYPKQYNGIESFWVHTDQSSRKKGACCYQSFLSLTNNKHRTLIIYKKSHLLHEKYFTENNIDEPRNWHIFPQEYINTLEDSKQILEVEEGDLVIWDSRTYHQNTPGPMNNNEERLIQYLCFLPRDNVDNTEEQEALRKKFFINKRTTSHWPYPMNAVPKQANMYNYYNPNNLIYIDYDQLPEPDLDDLMEEINKII